MKVTVPDRSDDATSGQLGQSLLFCGKASGGLERASNSDIRRPFESSAFGGDAEKCVCQERSIS